MTRKTEQCLRINIKEDPTSLDPRLGRNMSGASQLHAMLFEGLMRIAPDGSLLCGQASSYRVSSDKKTYSFQLTNAFWSNGDPVTAFDFEKTWKDILAPTFPSRDANILFSIKNAQAAKKGEVSQESIGIHAPDAHNLIVELENPSFHFLNLTASSVLFPIYQTEKMQFADGFSETGDNFICNGPFKLAVWKRHKEIILEKNPLYKRASTIKLDSIHISMINNGVITLHRYLSGLYDFIGIPLSPLPFELYRELINKNLLHIVKTPGTVACMFNTKQFPFQNVNMRKAFTLALNRKHLIDNITLLQEDPALSVIPPLLQKDKYQPLFKDDNVQEARKFFQKGLAELNIHPRELNGKVKFSYWKHDHGCPMLPQEMQQQWLKKLGVKVALEPLDYVSLHEKGKKGDFSMGYFVFLSLNFGNSSSLLDRFKYSGSERNYSRWENAIYTALLNQADQSSTEETNLSFLQQAEKVLIEDMPFAPLFHWNYALLIQPYVKKLEVSPLGYFIFDNVTLGKKHSKAWQP